MGSSWKFQKRRGRKEQNCFQNIVPICVSPPCCGTFYVLPHCLPTDQRGLCIRIEDVKLI